MQHAVRWLSPLAFSLVPLAHWGEDFRYSRLALLLAGLALAWLTRPLRLIPYGAWLALAAGPLLAAVSWGVNGFSAMSITSLLEMTAAMLAVATLLHDEHPEDYAAAWTLSITGASLYGLLQILQFVPLPLDAYGKPDAASTFGLSNFAAETLVVSIPISIALFFHSTSRMVRGVVPAAVFFQLAYLVFAGSRAGWLGMLVALGTLLLFWRPEDRRIYRGAAGASLAFASLVLAFGYKRLNLFSDSDPSLIFRREAWRAAFEIGSTHPLAGVGPGRFQAYVGEFATEKLTAVSVMVQRSVHHPHNEFLSAFAELGVLGAAGLIGLSIALFILLSRRQAAFALASLAGLLTVALFGFPFQQASVWAALGLALGLGFAGNREDAPVQAGLRAGLFLILISVGSLFAVRAVASNLSRQAVIELSTSARLARKNEGAAEILRAKAAEHLRKSQDLWPADPESLFNMAQAAGFPDEKVARLREYAAAMPGDLYARLSLAQAQVLAHDNPGAEATLREILTHANAPEQGFHRLVGLLVDRGAFPDAVAVVEQGLAKYPNNLQLLVDGGDAQRLAGKNAEASAYYEKALALSPKEPGVYLRAGVALLNQKNYVQAEVVFKKGNELAPRDPAFWVYRARLAHAGGRDAEAKSNLLEALKFDPDLANNLKGSAPELLPLLKQLKTDG